MEEMGLSLSEIIGLCQVAVMSGIFLRLGNHGGRLSSLEKRVAVLEEWLLKLIQGEKKA